MPFSFTADKQTTIVAEKCLPTLGSSLGPAVLKNGNKGKINISIETLPSLKEKSLGVSSERSHLQSYVSFRSRIGVTSLFISNQSTGRASERDRSRGGESSICISYADLCCSSRKARRETHSPQQPPKPSAWAESQMLPWITGDFSLQLSPGYFLLTRWLGDCIGPIAVVQRKQVDI